MEKNKLDLINKIKNQSISIGISSDEVTFVKNLVDNKVKDDNHFVCEGLWATDKLINNNFEIDQFFFNGEILENQLDLNTLALIEKLTKFAKKSFNISTKACKKISDRDGFDEFFIVAKQKKYSFDSLEKLFAKKDNVLAIVMDGLEQPGNIGAILRSFDCAGGDFAIIVNRQAKLSNSRLVRSSLGASFMIPAIETDIETAQKWLLKNGFKNIVTDLQAKQNYREIDYSGKIAIIAGNEHTGISNSWREQPNSQSIIIPMLGSCESLNVGFASTLVSYEAGLQKFKNIKY